LYVRVHVCVRVCVCVSLSVCICIHIYVRYVYGSVCVCVCACVCLCVCVCARAWGGWVCVEYRHQDLKIMTSSVECLDFLGDGVVLPFSCLPPRPFLFFFTYSTLCAALSGIYACAHVYMYIICIYIILSLFFFI
jgi:hypothetical protein